MTLPAVAMGEESKNQSGVLATLARQGAMLRRNLRKPISIESRRIALERKITLDFPHFKGFLTEYSSNISMTGMFVRSERPEPPGTLVAFEFRLADGLNLIRGEGEVIWRRMKLEGPDRPPGMGLHFVRLDKESRRLIRWAIEKRLREGGKSFDVDAPAGENVGSQATSVEDLDLVHPGTEDQADPRLHAYAGAAVARSWLERWRPILLAAVLAALAGAFYFLLPELRDEPPATAGKAVGAEAPVAVEAMEAAEEAEAPASVEAARPEAADSTRHGVEAGLEMVEAWARAWSEQRAEDYLSFYAADFRPPRGVSRADWSQLRRSRITRPRRIEVGITDLEAEMEGPRRCRVSFLQSYASDSYRDTTRKTLVLVLEGEEWKIQEERAGQ